jgi:RimJ/RimL family protein N-acetyltransferase
LRSPTLADADAIFEYASDPDVTRYMDWPTQTDPQSARDFLDGCLERLATGSELSWVITVPPSDRSIGMISCRMHGHAVDFGYVLTRSSWGQGFGTEAARAVVGWLSELDHIYRIWATCDADNVASARVLEKAGLQREGTLRRWSVKPNIGPEPRDAFVFAKVRSAL